jgi:hypothetical protein
MKFLIYLLLVILTSISVSAGTCLLGEECYMGDRLYFNDTLAAINASCDYVLYLPNGSIYDSGVPNATGEYYFKNFDNLSVIGTYIYRQNCSLNNESDIVTLYYSLVVDRASITNNNGGGGSAVVATYTIREQVNNSSCSMSALIDGKLSCSTPQAGRFLLFATIVVIIVSVIIGLIFRRKKKSKQLFVPAGDDYQ